MLEMIFLTSGIVHNAREQRGGGKGTPPETRTPSEFTASVLMMALCPDRFWIKFPSGNFHCLMLSGDPEANVYLHKRRRKVVTAPQSCLMFITK